MSNVYFAPDTGDIPNWGCQMMSLIYRRELARAGATIRWRSGSQLFSQPDGSLPAPENVADLERIVDQVRRGKLLGDLAQWMPQVDLAFMNGENFIRPGARKGRILLLLAYVIKTVFQRPCALVNLSIDPSEPGLEELVRFVLPKLDVVQVRESKSLQTLKSLLPHQDFPLVPDIAWLVEPAPMTQWLDLASRPGHLDAWPDSAEGFDPHRPYLTLCASSLFGDPNAGAFNVVPSFVRLAQRLARDIAPVLLVAPCRIDAAILRRVRAETGLPLLGLHLPVQVGVDVLANARVHLGGRWHPGIFAARGGTPLVGFSANTRKIDSLVQQLGMTGPVFDPRKLDDHLESIVTQTGTLYAQGDSLRNRIQSHADSLRAQVRTSVNTLLRQLLAP